MKEIFYKIAENFTVSWDPEEISLGFNTINRTHDRSPYYDPSGVTHWQLYPTNVAFGRNFYSNYKAECIEVAKKLKDIQEKLRDEMLSGEQSFPLNRLTETFLNHKIVPNKVNLLKTVPGKDIELHYDSTRDLCINIGLKNSNKWETVISKDPNIKNFEGSKKNTFLMNDGDAYIMLINNPHTAICLNKSDLISTRFLITYTMTVPATN
jgi:hypothetical protein